MITRYRTPDGRNLDRDHGPGPVGLMPKHVVHGWSVAEAQVRPTAVSDRKRRWEERTGGRR